MKKKIDLSLILACYNEGPTFLWSLKEIKKVLDRTKISWEIICIDDRSKDNSFKVAKKFAKFQANVFAFLHEKNLGRGGTVAEGFKMARGKVVGFIDVDLEVSPIYIPEFVEAIQDGADVVIATRFYKESLTTLVRWVSTKVYIFLVQQVLGVNYKDTEAGYKFFNKKKILKILKKVKNKGWFFDTEIVIRSHLAHLKIKEIPVLFLRRPEKQSTVRLIPDSIDYLKALIDLKRTL